MPLYEYECTICHKRTEKIQKFSDPEITECPFCSGKLERVLSAPAVSFKGGGWYADLYSSSKSSGGAKAASGSSDSGGATSGGDTSAAPAAPSTPAPAAASSSSSDKK
jgi:putative FmdB family regulatory protein